MKIEIKNRWTGTIIFEYEKENNTIKDTVIEAVKSGADLHGANLNGADLRWADLRWADLHGANLDYSCLPLWCGGKFKADEKICKQLVAHVVKIMELSEIDQPELIAKMNEYKKGWHHESEF